MLAAKSTAPVHAYQQVKTFIKTRITSGAWKPGDAVPSETALMAQFKISRMTVNRALRELALEGMVNRIQGSGTRVAELHRISSRLTIRDIKDEVEERGHTHASRVLLVATEKATAPLAKTLNLRGNAKVFHTILVHLENGIPIQYEDRYVNPSAAPDFLQTDFTQHTPAHHLLTRAPLTDASYQIEACLPGQQIAELLQIKPTEACLAITRRTVSGAHVASLARLVYPGTRYSFAGQFQA